MNPRGRITIQKQVPVTQHTVHEIGWCAIEDHDLRSSTELSFQPGLEPESEIRKTTRLRWFAQENADIDVTAGIRRSSGKTAKEIRGRDLSSLQIEKFRETTLELLRFHEG